MKHHVCIPRVASFRAKKLLINSYITSESARSGSRPRRVRHYIIIAIYWTWVQSPRLRVVWDFSIESVPRWFSIAMTTAPSTAIATALQDEISRNVNTNSFYFFAVSLFCPICPYFTLQMKTNIVGIYNRIVFVCLLIGNTYYGRHYQKRLHFVLCTVIGTLFIIIHHLYYATSNNIK